MAGFGVTTEAEKAWMTSTAIHECAHALCCRCPDRRLNLWLEKWRWVWEGVAVWAETLYPGNREYLRFALEWCDRPDQALDHDRLPYKSFPFFRYLVHRFKEPLLAELLRAEESPDPWPIIQKLVDGSGLGNGTQLMDDFAIDSFFPYDDVSQIIQDRYGHRAFTTTHVLTQEWTEVEARVDRLACRYHRVYPSEGISQALIRGEGPEWADLQIIGAQVGPNAQRGRVEWAPKSNPTELSVQFGGADYVVLAVSNGGEQRIEYSLTISGQ